MIGSLSRGYREMYRDLWGSPKVEGLQGPNTVILMAFGSYSPIIWILGPLGSMGFGV